MNNIIDDREKKKRMERARQITNSITGNDYNTNFNRIALNNLQGKNDEEKEYINKFNRAREITNSINPRENVSAPHSSEEEKQKSIKNAQPFLDLIDGNSDISDIQENTENISNIEEKSQGLTVEQLNAMSQPNTKEFMERAEIAHQKEVQQQENEKLLQERLENDENKDKVKVNQNITSEISANNISDSSKVSDLQITSLKDLSNIENVNKATMTDVKLMQKANQKNENIKKGGVDAFNEWADTVLSNIHSGYAMKPIAGLVNIGTTIAGLGLKGLEGLTSIFGFSEGANKLNEAYNKTIDIGSEIKRRADYTSNITSQVNSDFVKTSGQIADVISNMLGNSSIGYVTGISGTVAQGLSVGGSSAQEVLDENKDNIGKATITGIAKGYISYLTEKMFDANILTRGSRKTSIQAGVNRLIANKINSEFGKEFANKTVGIIGENLEELVEDNAGYLIDKLVNNKDLPGFQEWWNNTTETAKTTTLSTMIMGLLGLGGESFKDVETDMETEYWIDKARDIIDQEDLAIHFNPEQTKSISTMQDFYVTQFNQDGEISNVVTTKGKEINNPNKDLNITPVVVKDTKTDYYTVIDGNTGVVLDSTYYGNLTEAENSFNEKVNNLSNVQLKDINNQITKANYMITQTIMDNIETARSQVVENEIQENTKNVDYLKQFDDVKELSKQISDKSLYNKASASDIFKLVSDKIKNIHLISQSGKTYLNSLNKDGSVAYQQKIDNPIYTGSKIKTIINNAIQNADLSNINLSLNATLLQNNNENIFQTSSKQNIAVSDTQVINLPPENIKKVTEAFNTKKSYTKNELAEIWNNEINAKDLDVVYDVNGDIQNYIAIENDGENLVVNLYDGDDNVIKSESIPNRNGTFTTKNITNAITNITAQQNETKKLKTTIDNSKNTNTTLQQDIDNFSKQVDGVLNGTFPKNSMITLLNETPKPLQDIGLPNLPMTMTQKHLYTIINESGNDANANYHGISVDTIKQLPEALNTPLDIVESSTRDDSVVVTTYLADKNDNTIIASIKIDGKGRVGNIRIDTNVMTSAYGKNNYEAWMNKNLREGKLLYDIDRGVIKKVVGARFQLPRSNNHTSNKSGSLTINSIPQTTKVVKNGTTNNSMQNNENNTSKLSKLNATQTDENKNSGNFKVKTLNDTSLIKQTFEKEIEHYKNISSKQNKVNKNVVEINTNILEGISKKKQSSFMNEYLKNEVRGKDYYVSLQKIIANNTTIGKLKNGKTNFDKRIDVSLRNEIKFNVIANLDYVIKTSRIFQNDLKDTKNHTFADTFDRRKSIIKYKNQNYEVMFEIGKKDGINTLYSIENIKRTKKIDLSSSKLGSKRTLQNTNKLVDESTKSNNSLTQNKHNVKSNVTQKKQRTKNFEDDGIRYMKKNTAISNTKVTDNLGRELSIGQQQYFKDSKVRDEYNNLITMYHGTDFDFNVFKNKNAQHGRAITDGYYFTTDIENAKGYGKKLKEVYIDIKNPFYLHNNNGVTSELRERGYNIESLIESRQLESDNSGVVPTAKSLKKFLQKHGYDGVITLVGSDEKINFDNQNNQIVIFKSNQAKEVSNINPTSNEDLRFAKRKAKSKNTDKEKTKLNAEREGAYIEQEMQKIEKTGNWDNSIPITKMKDIRKTIEDYLGIGIQKGNFRERAYAIYKGNRDIMRTKELKDIDSILHETGHALDLGNRLKLDKESISDELLKAVEKYGGYETEIRAIKLEEGFAEVIREYSIVPRQAKIDYPQSVAVIEKIRQNDASFDNFISKIQQQTYNYIHQNPQNRVLSNQSIGEQTDKIPMTKEYVKQEVMRNVYDKDYALKSAVKELAKINGKTMNDVKASENAYYLVRLSSGISNKVVSMLSNGYIDEKGIKLMPGLNQLGELLGNNIQRFNDLRAYLVAQRDLEYKASNLLSGFRKSDSEYVIEKFKNDSQIQEASQIIYDTLNGVMQYAVNNGLISEETANDLKKSNAFYVPMHRVLENRGNQTGKRGAVADIIKSRTGSELDVKDVLENIIANSSNIIQQVENNNILRALYKQGEETKLTGVVYDVIPAPMVKTGTAQLSLWENELKKQGVDTNKLDLEKTIDLFSPNNKVDSKNLITSFINEDGKRVYLQFNDELIFNSIMNMDKKFMSQVLRINSKMNMPLRYGATMANIGFAIPNMISDTAQATIYSTAGFIPVVDNALGVLDVLAATNSKVKKFMETVSPDYANRINALYTIYEQSGATSSTRLSQYRKSSQEIMKEVYGTNKSENLGIDEKFKPLKRLLDLMTYIPEISEQSTRFEVFKKNYNYYKTKGDAETDARIKAALESRDATQDFGRSGNLTREINQLVPFSAARVGSIYTFAEKVSANPKKVGMRIAILTALALAIKAIGYDDDKIKELNQRKKDDNFVLSNPFDENRVFTIKKPQGILRSIINLAEYIEDLVTDNIDDGKEGERLGEWLNNAIMDNMPADSVTGLVPNMVAPLIENAINKDFYYNTDIVKSYDLELPEEQQYYEYNSQLAIWLGRIFNYSPAKIDNLFSGYFGGLGTSVTETMDYIMGKIGISTEKAEMGLESNAVGKRFVANINSNSASLDEIYNRKTELTKLKNGGTITQEETEELEALTSAISNISKLNKQIKSIKADLTLSGKEKAEKIKELQRQRTDTARQALKKDLIYDDTSSKIKITKFYPSSDTLSKNGYVLNLTEEQKQEYSKIASEFYEKYERQGIYNEDKLETIKSKAKDYAKNQLFKKYKSSLIKRSTK